MPDFRRMYDSEFLYHYDLPEHDVVVQIAKCTPGEVTGKGGKKSKKPVLFFQGKQKGLALCKTNGRVIAQLYGNDTDKWVGKPVTLYRTTTTFGGDTVECIRVRPAAPKPGAKQAPPDEPPHDPQTGEVQP